MKRAKPLEEEPDKKVVKTSPSRKLKAAVIRERHLTSTETGPVDTALAKYTDLVDFTIMEPKEFHKPGEEWLVEDVMNALSFHRDPSDNYDFHLICGHAHQGQPEKMRSIWSMDDWVKEMSDKLSDKVGYPFGRLWDREGKSDRVF
jgi:hypothetical protein